MTGACCLKQLKMLVLVQRDYIRDSLPVSTQVSSALAFLPYTQPLSIVTSLLGMLNDSLLLDSIVYLLIHLLMLEMVVHSAFYSFIHLATDLKCGKCSVFNSHIITVCFKESNLN